jgi:hypothetical protein
MQKEIFDVAECGATEVDQSQVWSVRSAGPIHKIEQHRPTTVSSFETLFSPPEVVVERIFQPFSYSTTMAELKGSADGFEYVSTDLRID